MTISRARIAIGGYSFDPATQFLYRDGGAVMLPRKARELLALLVADVNALVPRERIFAAVWPEGFVHEGNLTQTIYLLRKSLAGDPAVSIENVPGRGYRLRVNVKVRSVSRQRALAFAVMVCIGIAVGIGSTGTRALPLKARDDLDVAMYHFDRFVNLRLAQTYFERTARDAPKVPDGYAGLALVDAIRGYDSAGRRRYCSEGRSAAARAESFGRSALAHTARAMLDVTCERSLSRAGGELDAALAMEPSDATALTLRARVALWENRPSEAISFADKAVASDPTSPEALLALGVAEYYARDLRSSVRTFGRLLELMPDRSAALEYLERSYEGLGEFGSAATVLRVAERDSANAGWVWAARARLLALRGDPADAVAMLARRASTSDAEWLAAAYAAAGDGRTAIAELRIAESHHPLNTQLAWLDDFRFVALRRAFPGLTPVFVTWR